MYTAMALVALTLGNVSTSPTWLDDYTAAQAKVSVAGKPMAVFVGTGKAGWESAVRDGFDPAVSRLLAEKFVCLYVDASTTKGKSLAAAFQVGNRGVILSDRTGQTQAYCASGTISRVELSRALLAYADVEVGQKTDAPKAAAGSAAGSAPAGTVLSGSTVPGGTVIVGPGGPPMGPVGGPVMVGGGNWGGYGNGGCGGHAMGGCGGGMGHGCCFFGGMGHGWGGGGCGHSTGGCGHASGCGGGMGHGCCFFGGMAHGWGGGCGGGMGHGCGGCK